MEGPAPTDHTDSSHETREQCTSRHGPDPRADFPFKVAGIEIEGFNDVGVDVPYPWEDSPRSFHKHLMHIDSFSVDRYPVTNAEFKKFLDASHYHPKDDLNFLRDWKAGNYPKGWENKPVTWVSPTTTRAPTRVGPESVCPTSGSGSMPPKAQTAASTLWGNDWDDSAVPAPDKSRTMPGPDRSTHIPREPDHLA